MSTAPASSPVRTFVRLLAYAAPDALLLVGVACLALLGAAFELARPWPVKLVVDQVLGGQPMPPLLASLLAHLPGGDARLGQLAWCVVAAVLVSVGASVLSYVVLTTVVAVSQRMVSVLAAQLFARLQRLSLAFHGRHAVGDLLQRVSADAFVVHFAVSQVALPLVMSLVTLGGMAFIMARIDGTLTLVAMSVVPVLAVLLVGFVKPIERSNEQQWATQASLMALVEQSLSAIKAVQGFAREPYIQRKIEERARDVGGAFSRSTRVSAVYKEATTVVTGLAAAMILWLGAQRVLDGRLSVGDLFVFLGYLTALFGPVNSLSSAVGFAVATATRGKRVFEILDSREEVEERPDAVPLGRARGAVSLETVTFGYGSAADGARTVLRDVTLHAEPGQIIAIVGATGAGKSSMVSLLSRFYDPWQGRVLVDGRDVREYTLSSLRENVSLVLQEPFLFPMSVADNIAFGRPDAAREEIVRVATLAQADEFIRRLPDGYDTVLSEKGTSLSGGERQRIAIARALLKDAPILILDEPTSALDAHTEAKIFEALSELMRGRTTFVISHRLSTIRKADQILAIEDGRIVERGTHERLLEDSEVYARLYRHQHIAVL